MPLLIYGANVPIDEDFTIDMLLDIDDASWSEFMPKGVNIFVICKTSMAKAITKRTLTGFRDINFQLFNKIICLRKLFKLTENFI